MAPSYGAAAGPYQEGKKRYGLCVDFLATLFVFFMPVLIFAAVYFLISYHLHYFHFNVTVLLLLCIFGCVFYMAYVAMSRMLAEADRTSDYIAVYSCAIFVGVILAFWCAMIFGYRNYNKYMQPVYEWEQLNSVKRVDPSTMDGKAFMDAGKFQFMEGSHLDFSKSRGFLNGDMYCVAPIVSSGKAPATYEFWAVGTNCCSGARNSFACAEVSEEKLPSRTELPTGGLRLLSGDQLPFYKLAVTQANAKYGITSTHPIFVYYVQDADKAIAAHRDFGWKSWLPATEFFAVFQGFVFLLAAIVVAINRTTYPTEKKRLTAEGKSAKDPPKSNPELCFEDA